MFEPEWQNSFTGKPADSLIEEKLYHSKIGYSYRPMENGSKAWLVVAPGLTKDEDGKPVYKAFEHERSMGYYIPRENFNPD